MFVCFNAVYLHLQCKALCAFASVCVFAVIQQDLMCMMFNWCVCMCFNPVPLPLQYCSNNLFKCFHVCICSYMYVCVCV